MVKERFLAIDVKHHYMLGDAVCVIIVIDFKFWVNNETEIKSWCERKNIKIVNTGLLVQFERESDMALFLLKWGNG